MPKKTKALTIEERLQQALVPAEEQPYEVPENWVWVRLIGNVNSCLDGYRKPINSSERAQRVGNVPYYGATGQVGWIDDYLTNEHLVLLGEDGAPFLDLLKDKAYIIFGEAWVNNHAHILKSYFGEIGNVFLMHYLNMVDYKDYVKGTTRLKLTQGSMQLMPFPLPPLSEQQRIVERIEELFAKLDEAKERLQEVVDSFAVRKAAILHKAFTGELTKQWRLENGVSDESWEEKKGEEFFEYVTSGSRGWAKYYSDKGSIFVRMGNLNHGTIELDFSDIQYVELPDQVEGQRSKLQKNDILISITADVGMIGLVREDMDAYINQHVALARPKDNLYAEFLAWYFVSDVGLKQMQNKQRGATKIGLGLQDIRNIILKIPTLPEQHEIVRLIDALLARERAAQQATEQALASIDLMKKSILARAFRGELGTNKASEASALELLKQVLAEG